MPPNAEIIFFHYEQSIYSHVILWYLHLRGIQYSECIQPPILPRPDLQALDIKYRRIPILAIGGDVYCDTRVIIPALEAAYPNSELAIPSSYEQGLEKLLVHWNINGSILGRSAALIPTWRHKNFVSPAFIKDRKEMSGREYSTEALKLMRPENLAHMKEAFNLFETTLLADGRKWLLGDLGPTLADINGVWPYQWLATEPLMEGALTDDDISEKIFPKTFAWIKRFKESVHIAEAKAPKPVTLSSSDAIERILKTKPRARATVDTTDPLQLKEGEEVELWPTDNASNHHDQGKLSGLNMNEVAIINSKGIQLHFPRWNFRIVRITHPLSFASAKQQSADKKNMKLIYHPVSPYSRKVYILAMELGIENRLDLESVVVAPVYYPGWSDNNKDVAPFNPLAKIPTLFTEEHGGIFDSRTICEFLEAEAGRSRDTSKAQHWRERVLQSCADGMLDAQVLLVYENKIRAEKGLRMEEWVVGQTEKIRRGFDFLEAEAKKGTLQVDGNSVGEIATAAAIAFFELAKFEWREGREHLRNWFQEWEKRPSFQRTLAHVDWKTGEINEERLARAHIPKEGQDIPKPK